MADFDDFNFDDEADDGFGDFGSNTSDDFTNPSQGNGNSDFGDFGSQVQTADEVSGGKSNIVKQAIIIVIIAAVVILLAFGIVKWLTSGGDKPKDEKVDPPQGNVVQENQNSTSNSWVKFSGADNLTFNENYVASTFTVTAINHYVKVVDGESNLEVKTVLTGTLSGFIGTYELEVPYSKGCRLSIGNYFNVEVQVGSSNEKTVVGEIKY